MSDTTAIVCVLVSEARPENIVEGAEQRECDTCGAPIWVSANGIAFVETFEDIEFICVTCAEMAIPHAAHVSAMPGAMEIAAEHAGVPIEAVEMAFDIYKAKHGYTGGKEPPNTVMGKWG